ncbi:C1 family peptidase [Halobacteriovorax sp.]|uniref:C1 family peptidase n=1 Tax=Halobacteriovorax sp. TaxID=2020862 RepID=UPI003567F302
MLKLFIILFVSFSVQAKVVDLKKYQTPVKDQKDRNTCAYFAVTALVEGVISEKFNKKFDISEEFQIFYGKDHFNEYADKEFGNTSMIAKNFISQSFIMKEKDFPYKPFPFDAGKVCEGEDPYSTATPAHCFSGAPVEFSYDQGVRVNGLTYDWITGMWDFGKTQSQLIQKRIDKGRPVVLTLKVYPPGWDNTHVEYTDETNAKCETGEYECYGHAILLTGYDTEKKIFMFKNSWGKSWGDQGYGTMSFDYVNNYSDSPVSVYFDKLMGEIRE